MKTLKKMFICCLILFTTISSTFARTINDDVSYIDASGKLQKVNGVIPLSGSETKLESGWYIASGELKFFGDEYDMSRPVLTITGDVHLILEDGCEMLVNVDDEESNILYGTDGIQVSAGNNLTIYAQSTEVATMGKLKVIGGGGNTKIGGAGIGLSYLGVDNGGTVTINGGNITAKGNPSMGCAGISGKAIIINNGTVHATGSEGIGGDPGPGIGGTGCRVTINNGNVTAAALKNSMGAGIAGDVTINNGNIIATGGYNGTAFLGGAGIGGYGKIESSRSCGIITITGGDVKATGGTGIGGGVGFEKGGHGGQITISGGNVTAIGVYGAGIGGGAGIDEGGRSGNILIYGEDTRVTAQGAEVVSGFLNDIGAGPKTGYPGGLGIEQNVFVALPEGNLKRTVDEDNTKANAVLFTADPESDGTVTVTFPYSPFYYPGTSNRNIDLLTGLTSKGKTLSVITTLPITLPPEFTLSGFPFSSISKTTDELMEPGASVDFRVNYADNIPYLDEKGKLQNVEKAIILTGKESELTSGWYLARNTIKFEGKIQNILFQELPLLPISGDVHLILENKCEMVVQEGSMLDDRTDAIQITGTNSLTVYAQSKEPDEMGKLKAIGSTSSPNYGGAGIGVGYKGFSSGTVTINGGDITATGKNSGAGISCSTITINGGNINAKGHPETMTKFYPGIGGKDCTVTINGGTVKAESSESGAGIEGNIININGGDITATGSDFGAGIGPGGVRVSTGVAASSGGNITISGGNIKAISSKGAGIGSNRTYTLIYGENTKVATSGIGIREAEYVFVALPYGNLKGTDDLEIGNAVLFTADPESDGTVTVTFPYSTFYNPSTSNGNIDLLTGLTPKGKTLSVITTLSPEFALSGFPFSSISKTANELMESGASVDFRVNYADNIPYLDEKGKLQYVEKAIILTGKESELTSGWYLARGPLKYLGSDPSTPIPVLTITGDVHLILENGCDMVVNGIHDEEFFTMTGTDGIQVSGTNSLTIYAQTTDAEKGKLKVIGGPSYSGYGSESGAGIGVGCLGPDGGGTITINGGDISATAKAQMGSAAISGSTIIINNGTIFAKGTIGTSGFPSPGIGGIGSHVTINNGNVTAEADESGYGAGISGSIITINGGKVRATGGAPDHFEFTPTSGGAGIGGCGGFFIDGGPGSGGIITITGGIITATGGGAGIGGGSSSTDKGGGSGGDIIISGGNITATGKYGAGIGGGASLEGNWNGTNGAKSGNILIYGKNTTVTAKGGGFHGLSHDIGAGQIFNGGGYESTYGETENIFVALPYGNLKGTDDLEIGNAVLFTADPESDGTVMAILSVPFNTKSPIDLMAGLTPKPDGKTLSVITSLATQSFALKGYKTVFRTSEDLMDDDASVDFISNTFKWTGDTDSDWDEPSNWENGFPKESTDIVTISGKAENFPELKDDVTVAEIHFEPGAMIGGQSKLTGKAYISYDFSDNANTYLSKRNRWLMLASPLGEVYPGDFTFGGRPNTWIRTFQPSSKIGNVTQGVWVTSRGESDLFKPGDGFVVWVNADDDEKNNIFPYDKNKGLAKLDGIHEIPFFEHHSEGSLTRSVNEDVHPNHDYIAPESYFYDFTNPNARRDNLCYSVTRNLDKAFSLAGPGETPKPLEFLDNEQAGGAVIGVTLIGNPYMAVLDFDDFYKANEDAIGYAYHVWTGSTYKTYSPYIEGDLNQYIAPLQGFLVQSYVPAVTNPTIQFNEAMAKVNVGDVALRSVVNSGNKLDIIASTPAVSIRTVIAKREGGQDVFGNHDALKIMNSINSMPEVYTLKPYEDGLIAVSVNIINNDDLLIPVGLATSYQGNITFSFTGMDAYDAKLYLLDTETKKEIDLTGLASYDYVVNYTPKKVNGYTVACEDRFFIRISKIATGLEAIAARKVNVFESNGLIQVIASASNPIKEISVYNLQGGLLYKETSVAKISHTVNKRLPAGVYVVRVVSEQGIGNVKVIIH